MDPWGPTGVFSAPAAAPEAGPSDPFGSSSFAAPLAASASAAAGADNDDLDAFFGAKPAAALPPDGAGLGPPNQAATLEELDIWGAPAAGADAAADDEDEEVGAGLEALHYTSFCLSSLLYSAPLAHHLTLFACF